MSACNKMLACNKIRSLCQCINLCNAFFIEKLYEKILGEQNGMLSHLAAAAGQINCAALEVS